MALMERREGRDATLTGFYFKDCPYTAITATPEYR